MKLHWCCGDVYLKDYINLDIIGISANSMVSNPNLTTLDKYYKCEFNTKFSKRQRKPFIVDRIENILEVWKYDTNSVEEIVMISCWEHFFFPEIEFIVTQIERVLKPGGRLIVDFPDIKKDIELFYDTDPEYLFELIYCNGKNELSIHKYGYTVESFKKLWSPTFKIEEKIIVEHDYPMIGMIVTK